MLRRGEPSQREPARACSRAVGLRVSAACLLATLALHSYAGGRMMPCTLSSSIVYELSGSRADCLVSRPGTCAEAHLWRTSPQRGGEPGCRSTDVGQSAPLKGQSVVIKLWATVCMCSLLLASAAFSYAMLMKWQA